MVTAEKIISMNFCSLGIQISFWNWTSRKKISCSISTTAVPLPPGNSCLSFILLESQFIIKRSGSQCVSFFRCTLMLTIEFRSLQRWLVSHWCLPYPIQITWKYKKISVQLHCKPKKSFKPLNTDFCSHLFLFKFLQRAFLKNDFLIKLILRKEKKREKKMISGLLILFAPHLLPFHLCLSLSLFTFHLWATLKKSKIIYQVNVSKIEEGKEDILLHC